MATEELAPAQKRASLDTLKNIRLGIEVGAFLRKLIFMVQEPWQSATGGVPLTLASLINREIDLLRFVFFLPRVALIFLSERETLNPFSFSVGCSTRDLCRLEAPST